MTALERLRDNPEAMTGSGGSITEESPQFRTGGWSTLGDIVSLLDDRYAREILVETSVEPLSGVELAQRCDASEPTVYRRIDRLCDHGLLEGTQVIDPDGNHFKRYEADLAHVCIDLDGGEFSVTVGR